MHILSLRFPWLYIFVTQEREREMFRLLGGGSNRSLTRGIDRLRF
jgi:hypothetical protein